MPRGDGKKSGERRVRYIRDQSLLDLAKSHTPKLERRLAAYKEQKLSEDEGYNRPGSQK